MNWQAYIKSFQSYLKIERGLSQNTIDNYSFDLLRLTQFLDDNSISKNPITIGEEEIQLFIYAVSKEVNPRSQARGVCQRLRRSRPSHEGTSGAGRA